MKQALGPGHPLVAQEELGLSRVEAQRGSLARAFDLSLDSERIGRDHLRLTGRSFAEEQALRYAAERPFGLDLALSVAVGATGKGAHARSPRCADPIAGRRARRNGRSQSLGGELDEPRGRAPGRNPRGTPRAPGEPDGPRARRPGTRDLSRAARPHPRRQGARRARPGSGERRVRRRAAARTAGARRRGGRASAQERARGLRRLPPSGASEGNRRRGREDRARSACEAGALAGRPGFRVGQGRSAGSYGWAPSTPSIRWYVAGSRKRRRARSPSAEPSSSPRRPIARQGRRYATPSGIPSQPGSARSIGCSSCRTAR